MRVVSWTVVFGAVSALIYTSMKPFWSQLEWPDVPRDQARGAMVAPGREAAPERSGRDLAEESATVSDPACRPDPMRGAAEECAQFTP